MNTFKRKALLTAVLAGLGAVGTAEANLGPNVSGQAFNYKETMVQTYVEAVSKNNLGAVRENLSSPVGNLQAMNVRTSPDFSATFFGATNGDIKTGQGFNLRAFGGLFCWESTAAAGYKAATS